MIVEVIRSIGLKNKGDTRMYTKEIKNETKLFEGYSFVSNNKTEIVVAKKEIIIPEGIISPEKEIIFLDEVNEDIKISSITKGGIIL